LKSIVYIKCNSWHITIRLAKLARWKIKLGVLPKIDQKFENNTMLKDPNNIIKVSLFVCFLVGLHIWKIKVFSKKTMWWKVKGDEALIQWYNTIDHWIWYMTKFWQLLVKGKGVVDCYCLLCICVICLLQIICGSLVFAISCYDGAWCLVFVWLSSLLGGNWWFQS
jgi:hypothetical protein